jgi:anaerobic selenocysteine-containing dehydrogenase
MEAVSRRGFLKQAGAAAVVAVAGTSIATVPAGVAGALASRSAHEPELTPDEALKSGEDLVAQVVDARTGEISLFIGKRQVTLHDKNVAARLVRATR